MDEKEMEAEKAEKGRMVKGAASGSRRHQRIQRSPRALSWRDLVSAGSKFKPDIGVLDDDQDQASERAKQPPLSKEEQLKRVKETSGQDEEEEAAEMGMMMKGAGIGSWRDIAAVSIGAEREDPTVDTGSLGHKFKPDIGVLNDDDQDGASERAKQPPLSKEEQLKRIEDMRREDEEEEAAERAKHPNEDWSDELAVKARYFREGWESIWSDTHGPFDKITSLQPMRHTYRPSYDSLVSSLQIFHIKITQLRRGLQWPIHVFGLIAVRDLIDRNRNIVFERSRGDCQILTEEDSYLLLTGPSRAVLEFEPLYFEVVLKVKGPVESEDKNLSPIESEDKDLSLLTVQLPTTGGRYDTYFTSREYTSRLSTLEFAFTTVARSVEATISVKFIHGSFPYSAKFEAFTSKLADNRVSLLLYKNGKVSVDGDGKIKLSRRVVSVEYEGELTVTLLASGLVGEKYDKKVSFTPQRNGKSSDVLDVGFCKFKVSVVWSGVYALI